MVDINQFHQLVVQMLSADNEVRSAAEKQYDSISLADKSMLLFKLYLEPSFDAESRSMSLVLLRRILSNDYQEVWRSLGVEVQNTFCEQLLQSASDEQNGILRKRLADVIAEVARNTIDDDTGNQKWTGVLQFLQHCTTSESSTLRETGMLLIENVPNIFGADQERYMNGIKHMFQASLLYGADSSVRTAAVRAYVAFVCDNDEDDRVIRTLSDLIPAVIEVCKHVVQTEDDDDVPLQCLSDLATTVPKTLVSHFNDIFSLCAHTVADKDKDDSYRHSSLEVMVSLCESSPAVMRKKGAIYIPTIIEQCLSLMTEMDDDISDWLNTDNAEEETEEENATVGETSLDRVVCALGGKACLQTCLHGITQLIKDQDWKRRHAGIMGMSTIGEGCKRQMEPLIKQITVDMVLPAMHDPHPRVRYAACNAIGQMCTDFAPTIQKKCHEKIVPELLTALVNLEQPRVAAHAGAALVNFSEDCPKTIITIYLQQMMEKMEFVLEQTFKQLLENRKKIVLEQIITTIASVADSAQDHFVQFYDRLIPPLKYILQNATTEELRTLRGKTIECISLIGLAVGRDVFRKDADEIMRLLLSTFQNGTTFEVGDDPQVSFLISAWARICKILGEEFAPYLEHVMPAVIRAAEFKPDVTVVDEQDIEGADDEPDWSYISIGDQKSVGIKTSGLEDKSTACEMLVCYARELKSAFIPWVEPVMNLMLPMMRFIFHDGVRSAAAEIFPCLLMCAKDKGPQLRLQMWQTILPAYKEAINKESDLEVLCELLYGMGQCVEELGSELVSPQDLETIFTILHEQLNAYDERRVQREKASKEDEIDEDSQEQMNDIVELETSVLARIADVMHFTFGAFNEKLIPYFDRLLPQFQALLDDSRPFQDRQWAICIFDDLIEFGGSASIHYSQIFYNPMIKALADNFPEVRQAAAFGFGIMGMKGGANYAQLVAQALEPLAAMVARPDARDSEEATSATENAISAVSKILKYNHSQIDVDQVIPTFISWLPIWEDADEVPYVYDYFCDLVEANHPLVLGENNANLPRIFTIIVHALARDAFEVSNELAATTKGRLTNILKMIHANNEVFQAILGSVELTPTQQQALQQILSQ